MNILTKCKLIGKEKISCHCTFKVCLSVGGSSLSKPSVLWGRWNFWILVTFVYHIYFIYSCQIRKSQIFTTLDETWWWYWLVYCYFMPDHFMSDHFNPRIVALDLIYSTVVLNIPPTQIGNCRLVLVLFLLINFHPILSSI